MNEKGEVQLNIKFAKHEERLVLFFQSWTKRRTPPKKKKIKMH